MPINAELTARIYNITIQDDTAASVTPDGGIEVRRTTRPRSAKDSFRFVFPAPSQRRAGFLFW